MGRSQNFSCYKVTWNPHPEPHRNFGSILPPFKIEIKFHLDYQQQQQQNEFSFVNWFVDILLDIHFVSQKCQNKTAPEKLNLPRLDLNLSKLCFPHHPTLPLALPEPTHQYQLLSPFNIQSTRPRKWWIPEERDDEHLGWNEQHWSPLQHHQIPPNPSFSLNHHYVPFTHCKTVVTRISLSLFNYSKCI